MKNVAQLAAEDVLGATKDGNIEVFIVARAADRRTQAAKPTSS